MQSAIETSEWNAETDLSTLDREDLNDYLLEYPERRAELPDWDFDPDVKVEHLGVKCVFTERWLVTDWETHLNPEKYDLFGGVIIFPDQDDWNVSAMLVDHAVDAAIQDGWIPYENNYWGVWMTKDPNAEPHEDFKSYFENAGA